MNEFQLEPYKDGGPLYVRAPLFPTLGDRRWIKFARYSKLDNCLGRAQQHVEMTDSGDIQMVITMDGEMYTGVLVRVVEDEEE